MAGNEVIDKTQVSSQHENNAMDENLKSCSINQVTCDRSKSPEYIVIALLLVLMLNGFVLRCIGLDRSFWGDEYETIMDTIGSYGEIWIGYGQPLLFFFTKALLSIGGEEAFLRLPHVLAGVAGIFMIYVLGKKMHGSICGLIAAILLSFSSVHVHYSQELRYYAMLMLCALFLWWAIATLLYEPFDPLTALFALSITVLGCLLHLCFYFSLSIVVLLLSIEIINRLTRRTKNLNKCFVTVCILVCLLAMGLLVRQPGKIDSLLTMLGFHAVLASDSSGDNGSTINTLAPPPPAPKNKFRLTIDMAFNSYFAKTYMDAQGWVLCLFVVLQTVGVISLFQRRFRITLAMVIGFIGLPLVLTFIDVSHWWSSRYLLFMMLLGFLFTSAGAASFAEYGQAIMRRLVGRAWSWTGATFVLTILILALAPSRINALTEHYAKLPATDPKNMTKFMAHYIAPEDVVIYATGNNETESFRSLNSRYYLARYYNQNAVFCMHPSFWRKASDPEKVRSEILANRDRNVWIVTCSSAWKKDMTIFCDYYSEWPPNAPASSIALGVIAAPAVNLLLDGGFENGPSSEIANNAGVRRRDAIDLGWRDSAFLEMMCHKKNPTGSIAYRLPVVRDAQGLPGDSLDPNTCYTLSLMLKIRDIQMGDEYNNRLRIKVCGDIVSSGYWQSVLYTAVGSHEWKRFVFNVKTGSEKVTKASVDIALYSCTGYVAVDDIQLEKGTRPSFFTDSIRIPRDIVLANAES